MSSLADFEARMAALHQTMEIELRERVRVFEDADLETIRREAHKLRGGFPTRKKLTQLAARAEELAGAGDEAGARRAVEALVKEALRVASKATPEQLEPDAPARDGAPRILVVDDDEAIRRMLVMTLRAGGPYVVDELDDGIGVSDLLGRETYDLIIVDAMMPGMGGVELVLRLREQTRTKDIPVVVLSAASPDEFGADERGLIWWRKPLPSKELLRSVAAILDRPR